jgi:hypothetical protein
MRTAMRSGKKSFRLRYPARMDASRGGIDMAVNGMNANIVRPASMDSDALARYVADQTAGVLHRLADLRPFYEELWKRFEELPKGQKILGCETRTAYAETILGKSMRSIQYALYGRRKLSASLDETIEGLLPEEFVGEQRKRLRQEAREHWDEQETRNDLRYKKLKAKAEKNELTEEESRFVRWYEDERDSTRYYDLKSKKNLTEDETRFVHEHEAKRKKSDEQRARNRAEEADFLNQFLRPTLDSLLKKIPPGANIKEFASLGRREAARKYHQTQTAENQERMSQLNQVADWLEKLAVAA